MLAFVYNYDIIANNEEIIASKGEFAEQCDYIQHKMLIKYQIAFTHMNISDKAKCIKRLRRVFDNHITDEEIIETVNEYALR